MTVFVLLCSCPRLPGSLSLGLPPPAPLPQGWASRPLSLLPWWLLLLNATPPPLLPLTLNMDIQWLEVIANSASSARARTAPTLPSPPRGRHHRPSCSDEMLLFLLLHRSKSAAQDTDFPPGPPVPPPQLQPKHRSSLTHFLTLSPTSTGQPQCALTDIDEVR